MIRVMLVEDNPGDTLILSEILKEIHDNKFEIVDFKRVDEALEHIGEDFDIMLLDFNLPDSHGIQTFNTMNKHAPQLPIIILTGLNDENLAINIVSEGAQDYLVKGRIDKLLLSKSIKYSIERKKISTELRKSEERYKHMVEKIESGLFMIDSTNKITYINTSLANMLGYTITEMINQDVFSFIEKKSKKVFKKYLIIDCQNIGKTYELQFLKKD